MKANYQYHNRDVLAYFQERPTDLRVIGVGNIHDWERFLKFIGGTSIRMTFPWENRT